MLKRTKNAKNNIRQYNTVTYDIEMEKDLWEQKMNDFKSLFTNLLKEYPTQQYERRPCRSHKWCYEIKMNQFKLFAVKCQTKYRGE